MKYYKGNHGTGNCNEDFIKRIAKSLKSEFIYSKAMDMFGIKYQGINIYFFDTLVAATEKENTEEIYSAISDIEYQIDILKYGNFKKIDKS